MNENLKTIYNELSKKLKKKNIEYQKLNFLAGDASPRRYFIIKQGEKTNVLMLDNQAENLEKFLTLTKLLKDFVSVPKIVNDCSDLGILIIENYNNKFSEVLTLCNKKKLYKIAMDALVYIHKKNPFFNLPSYTKNCFFKETDLFFDWFLEEQSAKKILKLKNDFNNIFNNYLDNVFLLPQVFIHRDYHVDNLFNLIDRKGHYRCGWIDYQDALIGPCVYDLVSLTQDARVDVDKEIEDIIINSYLKTFNKIDKKIFFLSYKVIAIQRHLKVLGIFSRLAKRDNKKSYLKHLPRVLKLLKLNLNASEFKPLRNMLLPLIKF